MMALRALLAMGTVACGDDADAPTGGAGAEDGGGGEDADTGIDY